MAESLFGARFDFSNIIIYRTPPNANGYSAQAVTNEIYIYHEDLWSDDYSQEEFGRKRQIFMHELTHHYQYISGMCIDGLRQYRYELNSKTTFSSLPTEAQATLVEDYLMLFESPYTIQNSLFRFNFNDILPRISSSVVFQIDQAIERGESPPLIVISPALHSPENADDYESLKVRVLEKHLTTARTFRQGKIRQFELALPELQEKINSEFRWRKAQATEKLMPSSPAPYTPEK